MEKEKITYWSNGHLKVKKFRSREEIEHFVHRKGITQYYLWGYCFMTI